MARGYRSPRNICRSMLESGILVTPHLVNAKYPKIPIETAQRALESLVSLSIAERWGTFYRLKDNDK